MQLSAIMPVPREGMLPAAIAQEHFWLFEQALPGLPLFNIPYVVRLVGALDMAILEQSFQRDYSDAMKSCGLPLLPSMGNWCRSLLPLCTCP